MKKSFKKIISLLLIIGMNWSAVSLIAGTDAYFNDTEISPNNALTAGVLDFSLYSAADFTPEITPTQNSARIISVVDTASTMDYNYRVRVESSPGVLCDDLLLDDGNGPQALNTFISTEVLYSNKSVWTFDASLVSGSSGWEGESCYFDFVFEGWQDNMVYGAGGFSDVERISNVISNGDQPPVIDSCMKINEVYYDPDDEHQGKPNEKKFEWIELYNACEYEVDLQNWYLEDNQGESYREIIHSSYRVKPGQFVVVAASAAVWNTYWKSIPDNAFKIALGGNYMFNGLANTNDRVVLYDSNNNEVDCVDWGGDNYCEFLDGSVGDVVEGHSISRKPKGYDTDAASDWMDTFDGSDPTGPNPGTNPHSEDGTLLLPPPPPPATSSAPPTIPEPAPGETGDDPDGDTTDGDTDDDDTDTDDTDVDDDIDGTDDTDDTDDTIDTDDDADDTDDADTASDDGTDTDDDDDGDTTDDDGDDDIDTGAGDTTEDTETTDGDDSATNNGDDTVADDDTTTDDTDDDAGDDGADTEDDDGTQTDTQDTGDGDADAGDEDGDTGEETKPETEGDDTTGSTPEDGTDGDADGDADAGDTGDVDGDGATNE